MTVEVLRPPALTAVERKFICDALRHRHIEAGLPWHANVVWTPSPARAPVTAAHRNDRTWLTLARRRREEPRGVLAALDAALSIEEGVAPARFAGVNGVGPWWPRHDVTVVCEPPLEIHVEPVGDSDGYQLHHADGPAARWADGWAIHRVHGVAAPAERMIAG